MFIYENATATRTKLAWTLVTGTRLYMVLRLVANSVLPSTAQNILTVTP